MTRGGPSPPPGTARPTPRSPPGSPSPQRRTAPLPGPWGLRLPRADSSDPARASASSCGRTPQTHRAPLFTQGRPGGAGRDPGARPRPETLNSGHRSQLPPRRRSRPHGPSRSRSGRFPARPHPASPAPQFPHSQDVKSGPAPTRSAVPVIASAQGVHRPHRPFKSGLGPPPTAAATSQPTRHEARGAPPVPAHLRRSLKPQRLRAPRPAPVPARVPRTASPSPTPRTRPAHAPHVPHALHARAHAQAPRRGQWATRPQIRRAPPRPVSSSRRAAGLGSVQERSWAAALLPPLSQRPQLKRSLQPAARGPVRTPIAAVAFRRHVAERSARDAGGEPAG